MKIPARYTWLVMPAILALLMTFVVSGISTLRAIGLAPEFIGKWMGSWMVSYLVAYPTLLVVMPLVRRIVAAIMAPPSQGAAANARQSREKAG